MLPETKEIEVKEAEGKTPETEVTKTVTPTIEELQKQIDTLTRHSTNKEQEAARVQKKLEAFEKAEEERKKSELTEIDRLKLEKTEADTKREAAEKELADERLKIESDKAFSIVTTKLQIAFVNDKARENVMKQMDITKPEGYEEAVRKIMTDEPYYFKAVEVPELDPKKKSKNLKGALTDAESEAIKKRFRIT